MLNYIISHVFRLIRIKNIFLTFHNDQRMKILKNGFRRNNTLNSERTRAYTKATINTY